MHDDGGPTHIHSHRNIIGFGKHGVLAVVVKADHQDEQDENELIRNCMNAVAKYKKTLPSKQNVIDNTPDPAMRKMLLRAERLDFDTTFNHFNRREPQCSFDPAGICYRICNMEPCKIAPESPKGICGTDADLVVTGNLLRSVATGTAQHGMHDREVILSPKWVAEGKLDLPILGQQKIHDTAKTFGIKIERRSIKRIASELAGKLLEDTSRTVPNDYKTIKACAPTEHQEVWEDLDTIPISVYHEVFEAYHKSGVDTDGDWKSVVQQFLRYGLVFTFSGVVLTTITTNSLFGIGDRMTSKVNIGALKKGYVNIAVRGHLSALISQIVKVGQEEKFIELAEKAGAKGIRFCGICCSDLPAMYRYVDVIPLSSAVPAELVLGTNALDLWIVDVQDVFPSIMEAAKCPQTTVIMTSESTRLPGTERFEYDHRHSNIGGAKELTERIVERAAESFENRKGVPVYIPPYKVSAEVGFSVGYVHKRFGSIASLAEAMKSGKILSITNMVGCNNPKVLYEKTVLDVTDILLQNNILILTSDCVSFPFMKVGYCSMRDGLPKAGESLRNFLSPDPPPVWHVGECIDSTRSSDIFADIANEFGKDLKGMPFAFTSPEWSNEKGIGISLGLRLMGINSYHCVKAQIHGSRNVIEFLKEGTCETLGPMMHVDTNPRALTEELIEDIKAKHRALGWVVPGDKRKAAAP